MAKRKLTPEQIERIIECREKGWSYSRIARKVGCSANAVSWHCLKHAADPPLPQPPHEGIRGPAVIKRGASTVRRFTPEEDALLLEMEAQGLSATAIGKRLGRRHNSVMGRLMTLARRERRKEECCDVLSAREVA